MDNAERKIELLAKQLARHYGSLMGTDGGDACVCTGLSDVCLDCSTWWEMFLTCWNSKQVERMVRAYLIATEGYYAG